VLPQPVVTQLMGGNAIAMIVLASGIGWHSRRSA
jgi:hypothetical protein